MPLPKLLLLLALPLQSQPPAPTRAADLTRILADYHQEELKHEPETATPTGDLRYNDQLPDLSPAAENAWLARGQDYILKLSAVDTTGLADSVRLPAERLLTTLIEAQEPTHPKAWQHPLDQFSTLDTRLLALAAHLPFATVKDYDDYTARLNKLRAALSQIMTNLQLNADQGRLPQPSEITRTQTEIQQVIANQAAANPYAAPLKRLPPAILPQDRKRIQDNLLEAITTSVLPAYQRLSRFVAAMPTPAVHVGANGEARALLAEAP